MPSTQGELCSNDGIFCCKSNKKYICMLVILVYQRRIIQEIVNNRCSWERKIGFSGSQESFYFCFVYPISFEFFHCINILPSGKKSSYTNKNKKKTDQSRRELSVMGRQTSCATKSEFKCYLNRASDAECQLEIMSSQVNGSDCLINTKTESL